MSGWIIGQSGTGKSTLLIDRAKRSKAFVLITNSPPFPKRGMVVLNPLQSKPSWNILDDESPLLASLIRDTVRAVWGYDRIATPVLDRILFACIATLQGHGSLLDIEALLTDEQFREKLLQKCSDPYLLARWNDWTKDARRYRELISSTENKAGEFNEDPRLRDFLRKSSFTLQSALKGRRSIALYLPHQELGKSKTKLLGSLFIAHLAVLADNYEVFIDDVNRYDTSVLEMLFEGNNVTVVNQYLSQLSPELRGFLMANCGEKVVFRLGYEDSQWMHRAIEPNNLDTNFHDLAPFHFRVNGGKEEAI